VFLILAFATIMEAIFKTYSSFQAAWGVEYEVPLNMKVICYKCDGSRSEMGYRGNVCPYCEGTGIETVKVSWKVFVILPMLAVSSN